MTNRLHCLDFADLANQRPTWPSRWLGSVVCFAAVMLAACGGGSSGSAGSTAAPPATAVARAPVLEPGSAATATVGAGGGSVTATAASGITYTLVIPPRALTADVAITLTPITDMGSAPLAQSVLGAVQMEPSGLKFQFPALLRIAGAQPLAAGQNLVGFSTANDGSGFRMNLARSEGANTLVNVTHFSTGGGAGAAPAQLPPLVPLAPALVDADDAIAQLAELTARNAGMVDIVAVFTQWYEEIVKPDLALADGSTDSGFQMSAIIAYKAWISAMDFIADRNTLELALAAALAESAPIAKQVFTAFINKNLDDCANTSASVASSLGALSLASDVQNIAQSIGLAGAGSGLDRATFLLRANNCLRPVMDPITLPLPLTIGTPKSLDAKAQVVFNGTITPAAAPFEFTVTPTGATVAKPVGFSDAAGAYTTVFTPSANPVFFNVRACLVLNGAVGSDICVTQEVDSSCNRVINGNATVETPAELAAFADVVRVTQSFTLNGGATTPSSVSFPCLKHVSNGVRVNSFSFNGSQTSSVTFGALQTVGFGVAAGGSVIQALHLPALVRTGQDIIIEGGATAFTTLTVTGAAEIRDLRIVGVPSISSLAGVGSGLRTRQLDIQNNPNLCQSEAMALAGRVNLLRPATPPTIFGNKNC